MARTLSTIYNSIRTKASEFKELDGIANSSKFSISNAMFYIVASAVYTFETLLDVFQVDLAKSINAHINGTVQYYQYMLKKYQHGDELVVADDFSSFYYESENPDLQIVSGVIIEEVSTPGYFDKKLFIRVASMEDGLYKKIGNDILESIGYYMNQIVFAGTRFNIVSLNGDIIIPKMIVYYYDKLPVNEARQRVDQTLNNFCMEVSFTGKFYIQRLIDAILNTSGIVDVKCDIVDEENFESGVFFAQYNEDGTLVADESGNPLITKASRFMNPISGYICQSTGKDAEKSIPLWKDTVILYPEA